MKRLMILASLLAMILSSVLAMALMPKKVEMIRDAECIAIVNITKIENTKVKGGRWGDSEKEYYQKATGNVEKVIKGRVKGRIVLYGMTRIEEHHCTYQMGRSLFFLKKDEGLWTSPYSHDVGVRSIKNGQVRWFSDDRIEFTKKPMPPHEKIPKDLRNSHRNGNENILDIKNDQAEWFTDKLEPKPLEEVLKEIKIILKP